MHDPIGDDPVLQACALAYLSDDLPTDAVVALHPERPAPDHQVEDDGFMSASLHHAILFHRPPVADQFPVHAFASHGYRSEEHTSKLHSLLRISYALSCLFQTKIIFSFSLHFFTPLHF